MPSRKCVSLKCQYEALAHRHFAILTLLCIFEIIFASSVGNETKMPFHPPSFPFRSRRRRGRDGQQRRQMSPPPPPTRAFGCVGARSNGTTYGCPYPPLSDGTDKAEAEARSSRRPRGGSGLRSISPGTAAASPLRPPLSPSPARLASCCCCLSTASPFASVTGEPSVADEARQQLLLPLHRVPLRLRRR
uniref:Uncharacterized protein n=1 Tax=Oryza meridionalis TaxID=40149 RepID=A0A0E0CBK8_9ORYZ